MDKLYDAYAPETQSILELIDTYCRWRKNNEYPRGYKIYHPSAFGKCLRNMQYLRYSEDGLKGMVLPSEDFSGKQIRLFDKGNKMHSRWAQYFEEIGILRGIWQCANPACKYVDDNGSISGVPLESIMHRERPRMYGKEETLGIFKPEKCICGCKDFVYHEVLVKREDLNMYGHADMILDFSNLDDKKFNDVKVTFDMSAFPKKPIVVDMKTCNDFSFSKLSSGPDLAYQIQLTIYANILDCEYGVLIYENKNNSEAKAFRINKNTETAFAEIERQAKTMDEMAKHHILPPPRPSSKDCYECKKCLFRGLCLNSSIWDDDNLNKLRKEFYGSLL